MRGLVAASCVVLLALDAAPARAQAGLPIVLDGTTGPVGAAVLASPTGSGGTSHEIPSSAGTQRGANLFHSFSRFGIPAGDVATFTKDTAPSIANVIGRVTGGDPSTIAGTLRSSVPGADLYLVNPAGLVVTPGAVIDVPAGLHLSTADSVRFADGQRFAAAPPPDEVLSAAAPVAFGFLGAGAAPIAITAGTITAATGSISLVGSGNATTPGVDLRAAQIRALQGDVALVSVAGAGEVVLAEVPATPERFVALAPLLVRNAATIQAGREIDGEEPIEGAQRIDLIGSEVRVSGFSTKIRATGESATPGSGIHVRSASLSVTENARVETQALAGRNLPVSVRAGDVTLERGGKILADSSGGAAAGAITIEVADRLRIGEFGDPPDRAESGIFAVALESTPTKGGEIVVQASEILMRGAGQISVRTHGSGDAGSIRVETDTLEMEAVEWQRYTQDGEEYIRRDTPRIDASERREGTGNPGSIEVLASERVTLSGWDQSDNSDRSRQRTGLTVESRRGSGGSIRVETPHLEVEERAALDARSAPALLSGDAGTIVLRVERLDVRSKGHVSASSWGGGRAGTIDVAATESVHVDEGEVESGTYGSGQGGRVRITAPLLRVEGGGEISSNSEQRRNDIPGGGNGGVVEIDVDRLEVGPSGRILADARGPGRGGSIRIRAAQSVELDELPGRSRQDTARIASSTAGNGPAGDISIDTPRLRVGPFARVTANAFNDSGPESPLVLVGNGGSVRITAEDVLVEHHGAITSDTENGEFHVGNGGTVELLVGTLRIELPGQVSAESRSHGRGGTVSISASRSVEALGTGIGRGKAILSGSESAGDGGEIRLRTPLLRLDGMAVSATSTGPAAAGSVRVDAGTIELRRGGEISSDARGTGGAGPVMVRAGLLDAHGSNEMGPSGILSRSSGTAPAASVEVSADRVLLRDGGTIASSSSGSGNAGSVSVSVADDFVSRGGVVSTSAPEADGGDIAIRAGDRIEMHGGRISADVGSGVGGNVLLAPTSLVLLDGSSVTAQAGSGRGGAIRILAQVVVQSEDSVVSASAGPAGIDGTVTVVTPGYDFTTSLQALPAEFVDAVSLLGAHCAARSGATASFVVATADERGANPDRLLPVEPAGGAPSPDRVAVVLEQHEGESRWRGRCDG